MPWMNAVGGESADIGGVRFMVPEGLDVTRWAQSPRFYNPTSIDIDHRGRVWVAEAVNYRTFKEPEPKPLRHPAGDRIMILEDTDGDGVCDSSKVFVQDEDLHAPLGVAVLGEKVVVSCSPNLIVYTDADGDDRPEQKEILLSGFGGYDHDHGLHSLAAGPDGRWYFNVGNAGPHVVEDQSGWTLRSGSIYTGGTPHNTNNVPGLRSDDGRIWTGGLALRVNPDGTGLKVLSHNFRNSYEVAIDSFGHLWQSDNDDQVVSCRMSWVMEGGNMGYFSPDGTRFWQADRRPGQSIQTAHWHQEDPGVLPAGDIYGAGSPTGVTVYEGDLLAEKFHGMVLNADAGRNTIFGHIPHPDGAGFRLERTKFLTSREGSTADYVWHETSEDKTTWFRPSDVAVGPDGAVYIADWNDPIVGGHAMHDSKGSGQILRVTPKGTRPVTPEIDLDTLRGQIRALKSPAVNVRYLGFQRLLEQKEKAVPALIRLYHGDNARHQARALWLLARMGHVEILRQGLSDSNPEIRVAAVRALRQSRADFLKAADKLVKDPSPAVRREAAIGLRDVPLDQCHELLIDLAARYDGEDRWYLEAFGIACDDKEEALYRELLAELGAPDPLAWSPAFADLVWRLHPSGCIPAVKVRASAASLSLKTRQQAVDTLAFIFHPAAAAAMVDLASNGSKPIREKAAWWVKFRRGNRWSDFDVADTLTVEETLSPEEEAVRKQVLSLRQTLLDAQVGAEKKREAAAQLVESGEGGWQLLELAAGERLPPSVEPIVVEKIFRNPDLGVRALAGQYFERPGREGDPFPPITDLAQMKGDPDKGREIFFGSTGSCFQCHRFGGEGRDIGPDLTQVHTKLDKTALLDSILNPSATMAFGYEAWLITLKNGETLSGFILADGESLVLKEISGRQRTLDKDQIASRRKQGLSVMPDNIALGMTPQQLVDLVAFLRAG